MYVIYSTSLAPTRCLLANSWEAASTTGAVGKFKDSRVLYGADPPVYRTQTN